MTETQQGRRPVSAAGGAEPVEHVAAEVDRLCWTGILLGLAFTMANVQQFAANGALVWSLPWWTAWLLDPMVSLVLLAILRAEQVTARYRVRTGGWVRAAKWFTLAATYVMNTWQAFTACSPALVVLHSVPPLVVFVAAEAVTDLRDKLGQAIAAAFMNAPMPPSVPAAAEVPVPAETESVPAVRRTSFGDYLTAARAAWTPDVVVTPAWVREATGCSRGLSSRLAAALRAEAAVNGAEAAQ
ncbi:hypothetical protein [Kutzneria buriramensis]|uniref:DUF2637 domain-containing protein n=1 Tax=Kutzneria buriramensis TaxID=1045776 RepID=A0A3E0HG30_9PSEU|nr:hypothetical protein [Kutzneria buriramensis]REH44654.1 hypothetical protein BCF44_108134 [Kutzneria buriramensis]